MALARTFNASVERDGEHAWSAHAIQYGSLLRKILLIRVACAN
jgi:hypothetical protein